MIQTRQDLKFYLEQDAKANRMDECSLIKFWIRLFVGSESAHAFYYLIILRHCEYHKNNKGIFHNLYYMYYKIRLHRLGLRFNLRIPENVCGYGVSILHIAGGGGCLINAKKVGNFCKFQSGVLLGNTHHSEQEKPSIGNNVSFGPGAKAFGDITIGDNAYILSNAVVTKSVPANSIVGGVPAKIIKVLDSTCKF